jgi:hypothetical protein
MLPLDRQEAADQIQNRKLISVVLVSIIYLMTLSVSKVIL